MDLNNLHEIEIPQIEIFSLMKNNIYNFHRDKNSINIDKAFIIQRKALIALMNRISTRMNFKSKTFYQAVNYLDIIFSKQKNIEYNYNFLAAACVMISSKYCENVPLKPTFQHFINMVNEEMKNNEISMTKEELFFYEIIICKILEYKLNYFTIYDFNFFFFGNGILKNEHLREINNSVEISNSLKQKILLKIYERSKLYMNRIINNLICIKYNSLLISICIMEKSIDYILIQEFNREDSFNKDDIKRKNKKYFWEIMKEFYKIEYDSLYDYQYLKIDCEKYKIFEDNCNDNINSEKDIELYKSPISSNKNFNQLKTNKIFSKSIKKDKIQKFENDESFQNKKYIKNNAKFLYKKVNITCYENKKNSNGKNERQFRKNSLDNKIKNKNISDVNNNIKINSNNKRTLYDFYSNAKNHYRNYKSYYKDNYNFKKSNTSSSPFKNLANKNINNIKRIDSVDSNSNSFDEKKEINNLLIKNKNINISGPYKKKIINNPEKIQNKNNSNTNNNININININNRILYEAVSKSKYRNRSSKKVIISKYIDDNNGSNVKGRNIKYQSKNKINSSKFGNNPGASPIYKRNISKAKYNISFKNNQNNNDKSYNKINLNSFYYKENDSNKKLNNKISKLYINDINYNNIPNSSLTSRNSFQFGKHDIKLTDSFVNIQMNYFNDNINKKNIKENITNKEEVNKDKSFQKRDYFKYNKYETNNSINDKSPPSSKFVNNNKFQNNINNNFNINFNYINEKI